MPAKILLYVCATHATAADWRGLSKGAGRMSACRTYPNNAQGWAAFNDLLLSRSDTPVYLVVDSVEEEYRSETLPHVRGRAQHEMAARKLRQVFRNAPFTAAWRQGREADKRRDDRFLFTALTNPELLRPWLEILKAREAPLAGIYLSSMVSQALLAHLQPASQHLLLVTEQSGGLRQSYFQQQSLVLSRLTPLDVTLPPTHITTYATEIGKTRFYLNSQRLLPRDERLSIILIYQDDSLAELSGWLNADPNFQCHVISASQLGARLGIDQNTLKSSPDALLLNTLAMRAPSVNLAQPSLRREFGQHQVRLALYGISILAMLAATAWGGNNLYRKLEYLAQANQAVAQAKRTQAQYADAGKRFPNTPTSAQNLKQAVSIARALSARQQISQVAMATVSRALDASPNVIMKRLQWRSAPAPAQAGGSGSEHPAELHGPVVAEMEGEISPFTGDYRAAITQVEGFVAKLKGDHAVAAAELLKSPLDVGSGTSLSGATGLNLDLSRKAPFKVRMILKDPAGQPQGAQP